MLLMICDSIKSYSLVTLDGVSHAGSIFQSVSNTFFKYEIFKHIRVGIRFIANKNSKYFHQHGVGRDCNVAPP